MTALRICSLLPSATEIVCALGLGDRLVAVTHECDYPPEVLDKPRVTSSIIDSAGLSARAIDQSVRDSLADNATNYRLDRDLLEQLHPDLILTQELCDVCAVGTGEVRRAVRTLSSSPDVVSLEPRTLGEVLVSILQVARLAGVEDRGAAVCKDLRSRLAAVREAVGGRPCRDVLTLEWMDPVFVGGHWVPEMVEVAGGRDVLGLAGQPSREVSWPEVLETRPEVVVAMPCGFGLERSARELDRSHLPDNWDQVPAVRSGQVYAVDGSSYFNRPGPRLVDGVEVLAAILHPEAGIDGPPGSYAQRGYTARV